LLPGLDQLRSRQDDRFRPASIRGDSLRAPSRLVPLRC
jgi:hypothetical protein